MANRVCLFAVFLSLSLAFGQTPQPGAPLTILRFAKVWDGAGPVLNQVAMVISGNKIVEIRRDAGNNPKGSEVIDLRRYSAIPGMIDVHTHITYYWDRSPNSDPRRQPPREPAIAAAL